MKTEKIELNKNFTKLTQKKGISLIVLIVTIIVIIILAAVVILTINKNNPVESANEATFKEDIRSFQDDLALTISKEYTDKAGQRDEKISGKTYDQIIDYIPSFTKKYEGKVIIQNDELMYEETVTEKEKKWFEDLGIKENVRTAAEKVAEDPTEYYGKSVDYTANGVTDWKIFYSDGNNVYLISSDYVDVDKLPAPSNGGSKPVNTDTSYPKAVPFNNVLAGYQGSSNITDERIKALNNDYFNEKGYTSTYENMRAVAYMLDIGIWNSFADTNVAEYAVGGPTIEMLMTSYNKKHQSEGVNYRAKASDSSKGYLISIDGGVNWANSYNRILSKSDSLYVLPSSNGANAMWLASPVYTSLPSDHVMVADCEGNVGTSTIAHNTSKGFRPLVCLKSNIQLEPDGDGYKIK